MTDFLVVSGISLETINKLKDRDSLLFSLYSNKDEFIQITNYLRLIGIKNIEDILIYNPQIFLETKDNLVYSFSKYDIKEMVDKINNDYTNIDIICETI